MTEDRLPIGWIEIAIDLRGAIKRRYPDAIVRSMSYNRGWLSVEMDDSDLSPPPPTRLHSDVSSKDMSPSRCTRARAAGLDMPEIAAMAVS